MREPGRGVHDIGGLRGDVLDRSEHDPEFWEKRVDAMLMLLVGKHQLITVDELRRGIEQLGEGAYENLGYYDRWIASIAQNLLEKGVLTSEEIGRKLTEIDERSPSAS